MTEKAFQDYYPDHFAQCYGCGRLNEHGLKVRSFWEGDEAVARVTPLPWHTALPGYVYGGFLASVIDCHSTGTAAAAAYRAAGRPMESEPAFRFLTGTLKVQYLKPTPIDGTLELRSRVAEIKGRKVVVTTDLWAAGEVCVKGEAVLVQVPEDLPIFGGPKR